MGIDAERFINVNQELICCICTGVLEDPVETPCHHVFCSKCISRWLAQSSTGISTCPVCRLDISILTQEPLPPLVNKIIARQQIRCDFAEYGCSEVVELELLKNHTDSCQFAEVPCRNEGCDLLIRRKHRALHEFECPYRVVVCTICGGRSIFTEYTNHDCVQSLQRENRELTAELARYYGLVVAEPRSSNDKREFVKKLEPGTNKVLMSTGKGESVKFPLTGDRARDRTAIRNAERYFTMFLATLDYQRELYRDNGENPIKPSKRDYQLDDSPLWTETEQRVQQRLSEVLLASEATADRAPCCSSARTLAETHQERDQKQRGGTRRRDRSRSPLRAGTHRPQERHGRQTSHTRVRDRSRSRSPLWRETETCHGGSRRQLSDTRRRRQRSQSSSTSRLQPCDSRASRSRRNTRPHLPATVSQNNAGNDSGNANSSPAAAVTTFRDNSSHGSPQGSTGQENGPSNSNMAYIVLD